VAGGAFESSPATILTVAGGLNWFSVRAEDTEGRQIGEVSVQSSAHLSAETFGASGPLGNRSLFIDEKLDVERTKRPGRCVFSDGGIDKALALGDAREGCSDVRKQEMLLTVGVVGWEVEASWSWMRIMGRHDPEPEPGAHRRRH